MPISSDDPRYSQLVFLIGPWVVGAFLDVLLQGILFVQFTSYFSWYPEDKKVFKFMVAGLALITTLKSLQSFALVWIQNVLYFTDLPGALLLAYTTWWQAGTPLMVACIGAYVQAYFVYRLYSISRNWLVVAPIALIFVFSLVAQVVATYLIFNIDNNGLQMWFGLHLSFVFVGDVLLTLTSVYFLLKAKRNGLSHSQGLVNALIRLTFQSAAPAAICAMLNLIFSQIYGSDRIISTTFNMALPKLYAVSMMYTLNTRRSLRVVNSRGLNGSSDINTSSVVRRRQAGRGVDVELGSMPTAIHVRTEVETVQHIDVKDMYGRDEERRGETSQDDGAESIAKVPSSHVRKTDGSVYL